MPVAKLAKKAAAKKSVSKKAVAKKVTTVKYAPQYVDPKIDHLVKRFDATAKAMLASASKTLRSYHGGGLEAPVGEYSFRSDYYSAVYPVLRLAQYAEKHWELMKFMAQHLGEPNKRNEKAIVSRRDELLDMLDRFDAQPLQEAVGRAPTAAAKQKARKALEAFEEEQRRARLGMTKPEFEKLRKAEREAYAKHQAELKAKWAAEEAARTARETAKKEGKALT